MNPTQKMLFLVLAVVGLGVWSYNGLLVLRRVLPAAGAPFAGPLAPARLMPDLPEAPDTTQTAARGAVRDPFEPALRVTPGRPSPRETQPRATPIAPPPLALQGILWDQTTPMATIQGPDGRSENLRVGMTIAGATVTKIEPHAVVVRVGTQTVRLVPSGPRL